MPKKGIPVGYSATQPWETHWNLSKTEWNLLSEVTALPLGTTWIIPPEMQTVLDEFRQQFLFEFQDPTQVPAVLNLSSDIDGKHEIKAIDQLGRSFSGYVKFTDPQSVSTEPIPQTNDSVNVARSCFEVVRDESAIIDDRVTALRQCIRSDAEEVSDFLSDELKKDVHPPLWLDAIVLASEIVRFDDLNRQRDVGRSLLRLAMSLKNERRREVAHTVYCALHRGGSLIGKDEVDLFEPFLEYRGGVDTRLAALQSIVHFFEVETDVPRSVYESLLLRVVKLTEKYLDPDVLMPGDVGALAIEGLLAIRLMDVERFEQIQNARLPAPRWFENLLKKRIHEVRVPPRSTATTS